MNCGRGLCQSLNGCQIFFNFPLLAKINYWSLNHWCWYDGSSSVQSDCRIINLVFVFLLISLFFMVFLFYQSSWTKSTLVPFKLFFLFSPQIVLLTIVLHFSDYSLNALTGKIVQPLKCIFVIRSSFFILFAFVFFFNDWNVSILICCHKVRASSCLALEPCYCL